MIVSSKGRYALRVMVALAQRQDGGYTPLKDYFDKNNIPYDADKFQEIDHDELHNAVHGE